MKHGYSFDTVTVKMGLQCPADHRKRCHFEIPLKEFQYVYLAFDA